jgi:hypothetical protein
VDDVEAIRGLLHAYAARLDAGDLDGVADLFAHATWRSPGRAAALRGRAEVRRVYDDVILYDGVPRTQHVITNVAIDRSGSNAATSVCSFTVLQAVAGFPLQPILAGRYHDEFERVAGEWRFHDRLVLPDLVGDLSRHMRGARAPA